MVSRTSGSGLAIDQNRFDLTEVAQSTPVAFPTRSPATQHGIDGIDFPVALRLVDGGDRLSFGKPLGSLSGGLHPLPVRPGPALSASPGFSALPAATQERMLAEVARAPELLQSLQRLAASESFRGLAPEIQTLAVHELAKHAPAGVPPRGDFGAGPVVSIGAINRKTITDLVTLPGFSQLSADQQSQLLRVVGGSNPVSDRARVAMRNQLPGLQASDPATAAEGLRTFLRDQSYLTDGARDIFTPQGPVKPYTVSAGTDVMANLGVGGASVAAKQYQVTIEGQTFKVTIAEPPPADAPTADTVARSLANMPRNALRYTKEILISADTTKGGGEDLRNGVIAIYPGFSKQDDLDRLMFHETGHVFHDALLGEWGYDDRWNDWRVAVASDGLYVSDYAHRTNRDLSDSVTGRKNTGEDFAETILTYWSVKGTPREAEMRELMPARFALLDKLSLQANLQDIFAALQQR